MSSIPIVDGEQDTTQDRVTIQEAARRLGVKEDAVELYFSKVYGATR
jgi:hypothetical protein